ncbi:MAG: PilZ domain-containing protein [Candidatus Tectomicrobia bacterium]|uniref:PilZ domain-containing protein n=1 Tax=Tectimicrobiota bacterium TaxID=2528274 RepID=A0A933LP98_UNCTE|nr:PilZ domain-containing protein [Candidatus Tectomicrobia bacterium]
MRMPDFIDYNQEVLLQVEANGKKEFSLPCRVKEIRDASLLLLVIDGAEKIKNVLPGTQGTLFGFKGPNEYKVSVKIIEVNSLPEVRLLLTELDTGKQRREFVRVDASFPVLFQIVDPNILDVIKDEHEKGSRGQRDPSLIPMRFWQREREEMEKMQDFEIILIQMMLGIHQKLDLLVSLAEKKTPSPFKEARCFDLAGSGMGLIARGEFQAGDHLELRFTLPMIPPATIEALGKIVYVKSLSLPNVDKGDCQLGLQFIFINEDYRDLIIWYTFQQQRRLLRKRHRAD